MRASKNPVCDLTLAFGSNQAVWKDIPKVKYIKYRDRWTSADEHVHWAWIRNTNFEIMKSSKEKRVVFSLIHFCYKELYLIITG